MSKLKKTTKAKEVSGYKNYITAEQLETIKDQQNKLQNTLVDIGYLESRKFSLVQVQIGAAAALEATKKELSDQYGRVDIDLKDGSYTLTKKDEEGDAIVMKKA